MHRALNDYLFDNRVFMQIGYDSPSTQRPRRLFWICLTDCSYSVNVGQYMRFLDLDNFHGTFTQMHNAVLMDRVAADMGRVHLRGRGVDVGNAGQLLSSDDSHGYLSERGAGGLHDDMVLRLSSRTDAEILSAIRRLRVALCHFMFCYIFNHFITESTYRFLPGSDIFREPEWLEMFVEAFADLDTQALMRQVARDPAALLVDEEPGEVMARCLMSTLACDNPDDYLRGGAIQLRNRRVTTRRGLRPRNTQGRAITTSDLRRQRRRVVQRFVDRLPRVTRRRRAAPPVAPVVEEEMPPEEEEEREEEEEEETFFDEVVRTALEAIGALQDELSGTARRHQLFRFGTDFYRLILAARDGGMMNESFLRKWVLYFFLAEHVASTLYYLYSHFIANREFRRYVDVQTLQLLVVGWDVNAQQVFKRIWSEQSNPATIFEALWERVLRDFLMMVERTGQFDGMDDTDQQLFLSDIQYRDKSGDIEEVLKQLNLSEELIDSIDISFRIKFRGIVAISTNEQIKANLRRVLRQYREQFQQP
nr:MAG: pTP protein [Otus scops adenovirus]